MKGNSSKPGAGGASSSSKGNFPYKKKAVSSPMGKGSFTGAGQHPYAKKGGKC